MFAFPVKHDLIVIMKLRFWFPWLIVFGFGNLTTLPLLAQKIVAWNLEWYPGKYPRATPEEAAAHAAVVKQALKEIDPDVLLIQEMRDWSAFADLVAVVPGLEVRVLSQFKNEEGEITRQQVGIASKVPLNSAWFENWKPVPPLPTRGFSFAALEDQASGKLIFVYSVHLKSNRGKTKADAELNEGMRNESVRQLLAHIEETKKAYGKDRVLGTVIGGDMNTNQDGKFGDKVVANLVKAGFWNSWALTPAKERLTWRGDDRFEAITFDYLFTSGLGKPRAQLLDPPAETSDHRPLQIELGGEKPAGPDLVQQP